MFNWAFIGGGNIATKVAQEITRNGRHRIVSVYSRSRERAEDFARRFNSHCYDELESAIQNKDVDGVYIATPHSAHYSNMLKAAVCKKPLLCEKSFTVNYAQARHIIKLYEQNNIYLAEAMWTRFNPVVRQVTEWVRSGQLGRILSMKASFCTPMSWVKNSIPNRVFTPQTAGGTLLDLGVYPISYAQMLFGKASNIRCKMVLRGGIDRCEKIELQMGDVTCKLSSSMDSFRSFTAVIKGEKGVIKVPMFYRPTHAIMKLKDGRLDRVESQAGYIHQFESVAQEMLSGALQSPFIPHNDTLEVMRIMDECRSQGGLKYSEKIDFTP